jgi:hypothetical protein
LQTVIRFAGDAVTTYSLIGQLEQGLQFGSDETCRKIPEVFSRRSPAMAAP